MEQADIDQLRLAEIAPQKLLIGGQFVASQSEETLDVISPIDGSILTTIARGTSADADQAVATARRSFEAGSWRTMAPLARRNIMMKWADLIERDMSAITVKGVRDNGTEISMAQKAEAGSAIRTIRYYAESIDKLYGEVAPTSQTHLGLVLREPVGVVAAIVPWNFPLMIGAWKIAPALAMGNSVVLKPAETASLSLLHIVHLAHEAGLPEGVLNIVTGKGEIVGDALSRSMDVDVLAFTGSGAIGSLIMQNAGSSNCKSCYLELGGKSPAIVFADAPDLDAVADTIIGGIFRNSGQVCVAGSRLIIEERIKDKVLDLLTQRLAHFKTGDPLNLDSHAGAINNAHQLAQITSHVETAKAQGAELIAGGEALHGDSGGYYYAPTIFDRVDAASDLFQKEVFGPVLSVTSFTNEEAAISLANNSDFGLAAGVFTNELSRAHRIVSAISAGVVHVNTYGGPDITVPLGGHKQSGNGYDKSLHALEKYTSLKTAWIQL